MSAAKVTVNDITGLASKAGLKLEDGHEEDYSVLMSGLEDLIAQLGDDKPLMPRPDLDKYPRTDVHIPENSEGGGWATKATIKATSPTGDLLKGRTLAIKDNVAVAGVRCTNGTTMVDWTPDYDATIVTRILDAGGLVLGKAACENCCLEGTSKSSCTGRVDNPYAAGYSAGGSSSGSGRLVGIGSVDMAIGGDQGGSIRIPATCCGIVGLKPTWGLVPYTGILSLDANIDHTGPMTKNVPDCATLLEVIAGADGWDDRQPSFGLEVGSPKTLFVSAVQETLNEDSAGALSGLKIGIMKEGFEVPDQDANVIASVKAAADKFAALGATVKEVSVPAHHSGHTIWNCGLPIAGGRQAIFGDIDGRKQMVMTDRGALVTPKLLSQREFDAMGPGCRLLYLKWLYCEEKYGPALQGKVINLVKGLTDAYDKALQDVDILVMPTVAQPPRNMGKEGDKFGPLDDNAFLPGVIYNTCPFDSTGHPSLSLPCGFVPASDNDKVKLPTGIQLVGRRYEDVTVLKAAAAWEKAFDWKLL
ncbi:hypothetical protein N0V93_000283 [Gnomoniopsis smithogilvyi]|uniref:Amidase domain-containing protein n=1 Tax=Gnomoniopsis smithogilvyi TaxID=1191159 RepID=A0A9W9D1L1_9PEZI|nr:hypothetical protein N0V93_000283 [Gnomoniopsis smithogilvyi]